MDTEQYKATRARIDAMDRWIDSRRSKSGWASYKPEEVPESLQPAPTNAERSAVEVYEFVHNPPERYFAYVNPDKGTINTWTGDTLGSCQLGPEYRDNFGGTRVPIRVRAINGRSYSGTFYKSSGDYCRIRACKS